MNLHLQKYHSKEDGFTLVELLIVVLIIGVLAAIAIPVYLGIQAQGYKSVVKADVNQSVKRVQVAVTEGAAIADVKANYADYGVKASQPKNGESVYMANSPSAGANQNRDYQIVGTMDKSATPNAAPINYTYTYDSFTGKFGETDTASSTPQIVLGSGTGNLPDGTTGNPYNAQVDATVTGGLGTTQYAITAGSLPTGYSLDQSTGAITGNTSAAGTYPITVTVTNGSLSSSRAYVLRVYAVPAISTTSLPSGLVGQSYSQTLTFTGTPTPTFALGSGSLPAGLQLDSATGKIYGSPTTNGTSTFTVTATNGGGSATSAALTIVVNTAPSITTTSLPSGAAYMDYNATVAATGNPAPTYSAQNLPAGLSLNSSTGAITGQPTTGGNYTNVQITADNGTTPATKTFTINIANGNAAPTGTPGISKFTNEGTVDRSVSYNYMWANGMSCATGNLEYKFLDSTSGYNRSSTFWQTWSNYEVGQGTPAGVTNTWAVAYRCATGTFGNETAGSPTVTSGTQSFMTVPYSNANLLTNGSFENNNMGSWGVGTGSFSSLGTTTGGANGTGSYIASGTTGNGTASLEQDYNTSYPAGTTLYGTMWVRSTTPGATVNLCVWNTNTSSANCGGTTAIGTNWTQVGVAYTITSTVTRVRLEAYLTGNANFQFDEAVLKRN